MKNNAERLASRKWGVFNHYLYIYQGKAENPHNAELGDIAWSDIVEHFDAEKLAYSLHKMNAGYYFLTLMQCRRYMCSPNEAYDSIAGTKSGEACSKRDLPMDIYNALKKYDIDLCLYYTGDGPFLDSEIGPKFGFAEKDETVNEEFVKNWSNVLEEYAVRYGDKVKCWWIDGCYTKLGYTNELAEYYSRAVKKGNPKAAVAFNILGTNQNFDRVWEAEDFTSGEKNYFFGYPQKERQDTLVPHILAPLGFYHEPIEWYDWGRAGCKHTKEYMLNYINNFNACGGAVTVDITVDAKGNFDPEQEALLRWVGARIDR